MAHALLVSDQHVDQHSFASGPLNSARWDEPLQQGAGHNAFYTHLDQGPSYIFIPTILESDYQRRGSQFHLFSSRSNPIKRTSHRTRPIDARYALEQISALRKKREMLQLHQEEAAWVAANRAKFAGRWVALLGTRLLAVGDSALEVFKATAETVPTPLIIRLDNETLPFAGW